MDEQPSTTLQARGWRAPVALVKKGPGVDPVQVSSLKPQDFVWKESVCALSPRWSLQRQDRTEGVGVVSGFGKHLGPGERLEFAY